jgi:hypothetical protein
MNNPDTPPKPATPEQPSPEGLDEMPCSASCFVAGIVKGLIEANDPFLHFGSLMAFDTHARDALRCGVVEGNFDDLRITEYGRTAYNTWGIASEKGRSYMWKRKSFILPNA